MKIYSQSKIKRIGFEKTINNPAIISVVLIAGCKKDDFAEIVGVYPAVVSTTIADAATGVLLDEIITATFNEKMNPATITQASFTPSNALTPNTSYTGTVTSSVEDLMGNALQTDYEWAFSTGASPAVISTDPVNNATGIVLNKKITATFSEPMDPLILTATTFTLKLVLRSLNNILI